MTSEYDILRGLEIYYESNLIANLRKSSEKFPNISFKDAMSNGQIKSKKWLIDVLENYYPDLKSILVVGGWYGILPAMMFESEKLNIDKIRSIDIDPSCAEIAETINKHNVMDAWKFKASTYDMYKLNYIETNHNTYRSDGTECQLTESFDAIINTSCEHLIDFPKWINLIPKNKLLILQSNNYFGIEDHVNCSNSLDEFEGQCKLSEILFKGTLSLKKYDRYMIIGKKK